jgi:regulator of nucleoside diphosphate kinase
MIGPYLRLRPEITAGDATLVAGWMEDGEALANLADAPGVSNAIRRALQSAGMDVATHLFNQGGRFFIAEERGVPAGFVRLVPGAAGTEIVLMVEKSRRGRRLGAAILREALKIAFFEMRASKVSAVIHRNNLRSMHLFARAGFTMERGGEWTRHHLTAKDYIRKIRGGDFMAGDLILSAIDRERLNRLIDEAHYGGTEPQASYRALRREIDRARVVEPRSLPANVLSMRSRALIALDGEEEEAQLVYPDEADWTRGRLSVLSPVGTALLGYREGDEILWEVAGGRTRIEIRKILYQPEAAGRFDL